MQQGLVELGPKRTNRVELGLHSGQAARHKSAFAANALRREKARLSGRCSRRTSKEETVPGAARPGSKRHPYRRRRNRYGRGHAQVNGTPVLAAIDVGTNACRLLIAVPEYW